MPKYLVKYYLYRKGELPSSYFEEYIKARGIVHCNKLAKSHAKDLGGFHISVIKEIPD